MTMRIAAAALFGAACLSVPVVHGQDFSTFRVMSPGLALDLAQAALGDCRQRGY